MSHAEENAAARERVLGLVSGLTQAEMADPGDDGWTIAAQLVHLAFWDRVHVGRLRAALDAGGELPAPLPIDGIHAINDSGLHSWRPIPGDTAVRLFADASAEVDAYLATLEPPVVERIKEAGLARHVERFRHRTEHGEAVEAAIRRRREPVVGSPTEPTAAIRRAGRLDPAESRPSGGWPPRPVRATSQAGRAQPRRIRAPRGDLRSG